MELQAILFDVNGTLVDIETDEGRGRIYRTISRYLEYLGAEVAPDTLRDRYFALVAAQLQASPEEFPEFDAVAVWRTLLAEVLAEPPAPDQIRALPRFLAQLQRAISRRRLTLYPDVARVLTELRPHYALGVVTDAQTTNAVPELRAVGLADLLSPIVVSGDYGYRKPDPRLFAHALEALQLRPEQALYVGNDMYRDIFGAQQAGLRTVFFSTQYGNKAHDGVAPDAIIDHFAALPAAIARLARE